MRTFDAFGPFRPEIRVPEQGAAHEQRVIQKRLNRVLAFTGLSIDDVVNSRIAKNQVLGYWKLSHTVDRGSEVTELERQWNPNGRRG